MISAYRRLLDLHGGVCFMIGPECLELLDTFRSCEIQISQKVSHLGGQPGLEVPLSLKVSLHLDVTGVLASSFLQCIHSCVSKDNL